MDTAEAIALVESLPMEEAWRKKVLGDVRSGAAVLGDKETALLDTLSGKTFIFESFRSKEDIFRGLQNCSLITKTVEIEGDALYRAKNNCLNAGSVVIEHNALYYAKNISLRAESVKIGWNAFYYAENCSLSTKIVEIEGNVLSAAKNSSLIAKSMYIRERALCAAKNSSLIAEIMHIGRDVLSGAKNSSLTAEIVEIRDSALWAAENCFIISDYLDAMVVGREAKGGAVLAKKLGERIKKAEVPTGITFITEEKIEGAVRYTGKDWKDFREYFEAKRKKMELAPIALFRIEKAVLDGKDDLDEALRELETDWAETKDNFDRYIKIYKCLELEDIFAQDNSGRKKYLKELETNAKGKLRGKFKISEGSASIVYGLKNLEFVEALPSLENPDEFIETFSDYKKREGLHKTFMDSSKLKPEYRNFRNTYNVVLSQSSAEADESANEILYKHGTEIIEGIKNGSIQLSPQIDERRYESRRKGIKQKLKESKGKDEEAKTELEEIKKEIKEEKERRAQELKERLKLQYNIDELKEELSQLSQHYLSGKPAEQARKISESIVVREGELTSSTMEVSVWDKNLQTMPTYEEYGCCAFLGGGRSSLLDYMRQPSVQLLSVKVGDKTAMAIASIGVDVSKRKVLMVDSVESRSHMFARKDVSKALAEAIGDYAKESGFDRVLFAYNPDPKRLHVGNTSAREFVQSVYGLGKKTAETVLFPKVYLEQKQEFLEIPIRN